ncbi:hypothetical protein QQF64_010589 [Cirrhinus molitorella]|uniref:Uncharacterized protein n=1 Tax=Cirrhinus molitorella TaxID=172907 RepID=A0ABR3LWT8_9TELE
MNSVTQTPNRRQQDQLMEDVNCLSRASPVFHVEGNVRNICFEDLSSSCVFPHVALAQTVNTSVSTRPQLRRHLRRSANADCLRLRVPLLPFIFAFACEGCFVNIVEMLALNVFSRAQNVLSRNERRCRRKPSASFDS